MIEKKISGLYDKSLICPICQNNYTSKKAKTSRLRIEKRDSDLLTHYKGENPLLYSVVVCNKCGFSYLDAMIGKVKKENKKIILDKISRKLSNKNYQGERSINEAEEAYKLAIYCGELIDSKKLYLGSLVLRLGWIYRIKNDNKNEMRFLKYALELFVNGYENESLSGYNLDKKTVEYLVGELYRRTGDNDKAVKWFNNVVTNNPGTNVKMENMAREQWQEIRK